MRIAYLNTMKNYYGGEVHLVSLALGMLQRGHDVSCLVRPGSGLEAKLRECEVPTYSLPMVGWYDPMTVVRMGNVLRKLNCQILHSHLPRDYYLAATATLGTKTKNVGTRHLLRPISFPAVKRPFMGRFAKMIAVSNAVGDNLINGGLVPPQKVTTIYNGIVPNPSDRKPGKCVGRLHQLAGISPEDEVVGFVGRICPTKGVETLVRAAGILAQSRPLLKVLVVGDDAGNTQYRHRVEQLISDLDLGKVVKLMGYVSDAGSVGQEFDAQVVSSVAEPFGFVTLEAMNQMCPVVVTNTGGSPEIIRDGVEGFLVPPGDAEILAQRLFELLDSAQLRQEMGSRGQQRVASVFSLDEMVARTEDLYQGLCP